MALRDRGRAGAARARGERTLALRRPEGEERLEAGDVACLPEGPAGAHQLSNRGESPVRALLLSTTGLPANVHYPDTGHWLLRHGEGDDMVASIPSDR